MKVELLLFKFYAPRCSRSRLPHRPSPAPLLAEGEWAALGQGGLRGDSREGGGPGGEKSFINLSGAALITPIVGPPCLPPLEALLSLPLQSAGAFPGAHLCRQPPGPTGFQGAPWEQSTLLAVLLQLCRLRPGR